MTVPADSRQTKDPAAPRPVPRAVLCPFCGEVSKNHTQCSSCGGRFDHLSRQATQNAMGPWHIRDFAHPFRPGCSFETIRAMVDRGKIGAGTVLRGPTTRQFWTPAKRVPSVANLLGACHNCESPAQAESRACAACGASFEVELDRQYLGLMPVRLLPGQATAEVVAASALGMRSREDESTPVGAEVPRAVPDVAPVASAVQRSIPTPPAARAFMEQTDEVGRPSPPSSGGGGRPMLWVLLAGVVVLVSGGLMVAISPLLGIDLGEYLPSFGSGESQDEIVVADGAGVDDEQAVTKVAGPAGAELSEMETGDLEVTQRDPPADVGEAGNVGEAREVDAEMIARIRELLAAEDEASLQGALDLIGTLWESSPERAALLASARELAQIRELTGSL